MRVLITGASGFVSSWTSKHLKALGFELVGFDCQPSSGQCFDHWWQGDVTDLAAITKAAKGCDAVLHLAVMPQNRSIADPAADLHVNALGTLQTLRAAETVGVRQVILTSSSAVYGANQGCLHENTPLRPLTPYGVSKATAEAYCNLYHRTGQLHTTILRFFNIYGLTANGTLRGTVEGRFLKAVLAGKAPTIYGDPDRSFDFVHIDNVTQVISQVLTTDLPSGLTLNVGSGLATSLRQLATWCMQAAGIEGDPILTPGPTGYPSFVADLSRVTHYLEYTPSEDLRAWIVNVVAKRSLRKSADLP